MLTNVIVRFCGTRVVIKGHARRDHVQKSEAVMVHGSLEDRNQLFLVARKALGDECSAKLYRQARKVDRLKQIYAAGLTFRSGVRCRRILSLGQSIAAVVH